MNVELRHLRSFVVVAEELNFTRAARRLHLTQQALSAQIRQLETRVGTRLFTRTTRKVELTAAGEALLEHARKVLAGAEDAVGAARSAAGEERETLAVGLLATAALEFVPRLLRSFSADRPHLRLSVRSVGFEDPSGGVRDGLTDVALVWKPFAANGLDLEDLLEVDRVAVLPAEHALAQATTVEATELAKEPFVWVEGIDPVVGDFWALAAYRSGPPRVGARITSLDDGFAAVRAGQAVIVPPEPLAVSLTLPGLVVRKVAGLEPAVVALCRRQGDTRPVVEAFAALARSSVRPEEGPTGSGDANGADAHSP